MPLDLSKLTNVRPTPEGHQAACPVCRQNGSDKAGNHLRIWRSGRWSCVVAPDDREHNRGIWALAGDGSEDSEYSTFDFAPPPEPKIEIERTWPPAVLDRLIADHSYWVGRGIPEEVVAPLRGGVATDGQLAGRYVIPIFGQDDGLVHGFTGRALRSAMKIKYKHIGKVSTWVWGDLEGIEEHGRAILIEGPGDRLALDARGVPGALVLWGVNLTQGVLAYLIAANPRDIVISTNNDTKAHQVGQRAAAKIEGVLNRFFDPGVVRQVLPGPKDLLDQHLDDGAWAEWEGRLNGVPVGDEPVDPIDPAPEEPDSATDLT